MMGRPVPSTSTPPQAYRKEQRAKRARQTVNKTIPALLASDARARRGIAQAELISFSSTSLRGIVTPGGSVRGGVVKAREDVATTQQRRKIAAGESSARGHVVKASEDVATTQQAQPAPMRISIRATDTLIAARDLAQELRSGSSAKARAASQANVAVLNMASPLRPGGGVLNGATSQEESLCVRTTLLPSLREEWYRLPELGGIWSPDVRVLRLPGEGGGADDDVDLSKAEQFYVDVISAAMMRFPDVSSASQDEDGDGGAKVYSNAKDRELLHDKIRAVMRILESKGARTVVLGAWGCGAYGNPVCEVAKAFRAVLVQETGRKHQRNGGVRATRDGNSGVLHVVFAVKDYKMAQEFASVLGLDLQTHKAGAEQRDSGADAGNQHAGDTEELQSKISELEALVQATRSPILKERLESTLHGLVRQLRKSNLSESS